jgi:hypothetical protein
LTPQKFKQSRNPHKIVIYSLEKLINQKDKVSSEELDNFFNSLEPIKIEEMTGFWKGNCFLINKSWLEFFLKDFLIFKWQGKNFLDKNNVKALIFFFLGLRFNLPFSTAVLREIKFRDRISTSIVYNYFPIIDNLRKVNENTVMGILETKGKIGLYFYLQKA